MKLGSLGAGMAAWVGALLSSLCCLLPLAVIALGLGSGAFMAVTMQYRWILIPMGILGVLAGFALYIRERQHRVAVRTAHPIREGCRPLPSLIPDAQGVARAVRTFEQVPGRDSRGQLNLFPAVRASDRHRG